MKRRVILALSTVVLILINTTCLFAQGSPCGTTDSNPDDPTTCPLDTWVWVLVIAVPALAIWQWYRQQQHLKRA